MVAFDDDDENPQLLPGQAWHGFDDLMKTHRGRMKEEPYK